MQINLWATNTSNFEEDTPPEVIAPDTLKYRNEIYDLSPLPDGAEIKIGRPFIGVVSRENGKIICTLEYHYRTETAEPIQSDNLADYSFDVESGPCPCPIKRKEIPAPVEASND